MDNLYKCLVLEDTLSDLLAIEMVLDQFPEIQALYIKSPKEFLNENAKTKFNIYIIDIMLNDSLTGIDLIQTINNKDAWIIIYSSMDAEDYYHQFEGLQFSKFYIKKPIDNLVFKTYIETFLFTQNQKLELRIKLFITLRQGNFTYNILINDINLIETNDHVTTIFTNENIYNTYTPLKIYEEEFSNSHFEKINRNTIINTKAITRVNVKESYVEIAKRKIPISRNRKQIFLKRFLHFSTLV